MQDTNWRGVAELIGVGAVVASLIFVGLQMRQSQDIARAENIISGNSDRLAMNLAITENPEIWVKGNSGEILTAEEMAIYESLISAYNDNAFSTYLQSYILNDTSAEESIVVASLAYFLHENPGAHSKWEELETRASKARRTLITGKESGGVGDDFQRVVREHVAQLKKQRPE